eukprot:1194846-Prorocentrum_minimum.AAC.7
MDRPIPLGVRTPSVGGLRDVTNQLPKKRVIDDRTPQKTAMSSNSKNSAEESAYIAEDNLFSEEPSGAVAVILTGKVFVLLGFSINVQKEIASRLVSLGAETIGNYCKTKCTHVLATEQGAALPLGLLQQAARDGKALVNASWLKDTLSQARAISEQKGTVPGAEALV